MQKFYIDKDGNYLGSFDAGKNTKAKHPYGNDAVEVSSSPENANDTYIDGEWVVDLNIPLNEYRKLIEVGGFDFNGIFIPSDEKTERRIIGATVKAQNDPTYSIDDWTTDGGKTYIVLDAATIIAIGIALDAHIKRCFKAQKNTQSKLGDINTVDDMKSLYDVEFNKI